MWTFILIGLGAIIGAVVTAIVLYFAVAYAIMRGIGW